MKLNISDAQQLFGLGATSFPELKAMNEEMSALDQIYEIYSEQKKARDSWSETLWADLDIESLEVGIKVFDKAARKLPDSCKALPLHATLMGKIKEFKNSLPVFQDLKNEALRPRHWKTLMEVTKKTFDMNPTTFTLRNLFAMELHNFVRPLRLAVFRPSFSHLFLWRGFASNLSSSSIKIP